MVRVVAGAACVLAVVAGATAATVNDVSQINPIAVDRIDTPTSVDEIRRLVREAYALEEYFIPADRFEVFTALMRDVLAPYQPNVINVSIRHAVPDHETMLAWARKESFAFVIYYKQMVTPAAQAEVGVWTRELIDAALANGGTYYLPYQLHATETQFHRAYPGAVELFELKRRVDPHYRFRNKLWDRYYRPAASVPVAASPARRANSSHHHDG